MGRRKIEIELVKDKGSRFVTFTKRRNGLFKKANELATLCGVQVGTILFSPGGRPYSFGYPTIEAVTDQFLRRHRGEPSNSQNNNNNKVVDELNQELEDVMEQLEEEKEKKKTLDNNAAEIPIIGDLNLQGLQDLKASLRELKDRVRLSRTEMEVASSMLLLAQKPVNKRKKRSVRLVKK